MAASALDEKLTQLVGQIMGRSVSVARSFGDRLQADPFEFLGNRFVNLTGRLWFNGHNLRQHFTVRFATQRPLSREQFIEDDAQAENVTTSVDAMSFAARLFGTHIGQCSRKTPTINGIAFVQRQAKVDQERLTGRGKQNIHRFDVPMNQAHRMGVVQCVRDGRNDRDRLVE